MSLSYFLQCSIIWLFSYAFYHFWLRPEKLPRANRIFLLLALAAGPLLPLFPLPDFSFASREVSTKLPIVQEFFIRFQTVTVAAQSESSSWLTNASWYQWLWLAGGCLLFGRMLHGWYQLYLLGQEGEIRRDDGVIQVVLTRINSPFSYGPWLFWPQKADRSTPEWCSVWAHERAHVKQGHSYDLLLADLLLLFFWWHPLPYAFRRALRVEHEYLADAAAAEKSADKRSYARLLLQQHLVGWVPQPSHAFHNSHIKNRIIMLTQPRGAKWKLLAVLPLLLLIFWACEKETDIIGSNIAEAEERMAKKDASRDDQSSFETVTDTIVTFDPVSREESVQYVESKVFFVVEQMPIFGNCEAEILSDNEEELRNCSNTNLLTTVYNNIKYPSSAREANLEGMVVASFVIPAAKEGEKVGIHSIKIARSSQPKDAVFGL
ncbi:MAG: M56 family metallopeptidase, partial [Bacteroidota bacterium]